MSEYNEELHRKIWGVCLHNDDPFDCPKCKRHGDRPMTIRECVEAEDPPRKSWWQRMFS